MAKQVTHAAGISAEAVHAKTGKTWTEWFAVLDRAGADQWPHKEIAKHLSEKCGCPDWWSQMVTVGYEQERGLRVKNQSCSGEFSTSASKTMSVPISVLFESWHNPELRAKWLPDSASLTIRKVNVNKSLRITWHDGTSVEVNFWDKGPGKSQAALEHRKLESLEDVARMKSYWAGALAKLQELLNNPVSSQVGAAPVKAFARKTPVPKAMRRKPGD